MSLSLSYPNKADESRPVLASTFKCWNCDDERQVKDRKDWGSDYVCPGCYGYLFWKSEERDKRRFD